MFFLFLLDVFHSCSVPEHTHLHTPVESLYRRYPQNKATSDRHGKRYVRRERNDDYTLDLAGLIELINSGCAGRQLESGALLVLRVFL